VWKAVRLVRVESVSAMPPRQNRTQHSIRKRRSRRTPAARRLSATTTPVSLHYATTAAERGQPSILSFRRKCRLFPHPTEMYYAPGIRLPTRTNYASIVSSRYEALPSGLAGVLPRPPAGCHIHPRVGNGDMFPAHEYDEGDVVIGILYMATTPDDAHVVFYEVDLGAQTAHVIDPNGPTSHESELDAIRSYFFGLTVVLVSVFDINVNEQRGAGTLLVALGFDEADVTLHGYCAIIAAFYLIDYACTSQWRRADRSHFFRASREWIYAPSELAGQRFGLRSMKGRITLFGRYLAYHVCLLLGFAGPEETQPARVESRPGRDGGVDTHFAVGERYKTFREPDAVEMEELRASLLREGRRISFDSLFDVLGPEVDLDALLAGEMSASKDFDDDDALLDLLPDLSDSDPLFRRAPTRSSPLPRRGRRGR
jgi:hypothetical protein